MGIHDRFDNNIINSTVYDTQHKTSRLRWLSEPFMSPLYQGVTSDEKGGFEKSSVDFFSRRRLYCSAFAPSLISKKPAWKPGQGGVLSYRPSDINSVMFSPV